MVVYFTIDCQSDRFVVVDNGLRTGIWVPLGRRKFDGITAAIYIPTPTMLNRSWARTEEKSIYKVTFIIHHQSFASHLFCCPQSFHLLLNVRTIGTTLKIGLTYSNLDHDVARCSYRQHDPDLAREGGPYAFAIRNAVGLNFCTSG
jgi:hypothetical protein